MKQICAHLKNKFSLKISTTAQSWFYHRISEEGQLKILIITVAKIVIFRGNYRESAPKIQHFLSLLKRSTKGREICESDKHKRCIPPEVEKLFKNFHYKRLIQYLRSFVPHSSHLPSQRLTIPYAISYCICAGSPGLLGLWAGLRGRLGGRDRCAVPRWPDPSGVQYLLEAPDASVVQSGTE